MANSKYAFQGMKENMARAMKKDVELSLKVAIEMSNFLKGRSTTQAKTILGRVLDMTQAIPYKKYVDGVGHRKGAGITSGRYPQKGSQIFIELIESAEANAQAKGLSADLKIIHLAPQKSAGAYHYGRLRRRKFKRCHVEIVLVEMEKESKSKKKAEPKVVKAEKIKTAEKAEKVEAKESKEEKETSENSTKESAEPKAPKAKKKTAKNSTEDKQ
jgi:large subunit ribosomal protein L22